ncbi:MAG: Yip1 family protein [bacterium]
MMKGPDTMENAVCCNCLKPLMTGDEGHLCAECAAAGERTGVHPVCAYHPEAEAVGICKRCGTFICSGCLLYHTDPSTGEISHYCRDCCERVADASYYCAWEDKSIFFYKRFWITWREIVLHSHGFFDTLPRTPDKMSALTFSYLSFAHAIVLVLFSGTWLPSLPGLMTGTLGLIALVPLWFIAVPAILFVSAASIHLGIRLQFKKRDFHQTFRIVGYASATQVLGAIPVMNAFIISLLAGTLNVFIIFSGLKRLHRLSTGRTMLAFILVPSLIGIAAALLAVAIGMMMHIR